MIAYHGRAGLKVMMLEEIESHRLHDQIAQGTYGHGNGLWRGCSVGCAIHALNLRCGGNYRTNDHSVFETELGIPAAIAKLNDGIFERLPIEQAQFWPGRFFEAIPVGADLTMVVPHLLSWILTVNGDFTDRTAVLYDQWTRTGIKPPQLVYFGHWPKVGYVTLPDMCSLAEKLLSLLASAPVKEQVVG